MTSNKPFRAAALIDRDGTLNEEVEYLSTVEDLRLLPGAARALKILNLENVAAILTTNQSGIARGYFTEETLAKIHAKLTDELATEDARLDGCYYCPAHPDMNDPRRKPARGMYDDACAEMNLGDIPVYSIGDRALDVEFGVNCGGKGIRVLTGHQLKEDMRPDIKLMHDQRDRRLAFTAENVLEAVHLLLADLVLSAAPDDAILRRKFGDIYSTAEKLQVDRANGHRIVMVNGCFDLLHGGHISYLESARALGDRLVLAVNSNASIARIKGSGRPLLGEVDRLQVLASLRHVDYLTIFHEDSAELALQVLRPHIHAKGTDYRADNVPELATSRGLGIETRIAGNPKENSSRDIIEVVLERARAGSL
ncbi:hypothetical protein BH09SUM1_BH09SUM1_20800 [soil metagenome]